MGKQSNPKQREDFLNFRQIGSSDFHTYITYTYLKPSSVRVALKRKQYNDRHSYIFSAIRMFKESCLTPKRRKGSLLVLHLKKRLKAKCIPGSCNTFMLVQFFGLHTVDFILSFLGLVQQLAQQTVSCGWSLPFCPCSNCLFL